MRIDTGRRRKVRHKHPEPAEAPPDVPIKNIKPPNISPTPNVSDETWMEVYDQVTGGWYFVNQDGDTRQELPDEVLAEMVFA